MTNQTHKPLADVLRTERPSTLLRRVHAEAVKLCQEQPDMRYLQGTNKGSRAKAPRCYYDRDCWGCPGGGCLLGQAFYRCGVDVSKHPFSDKNGKAPSITDVLNFMGVCNPLGSQDEYKLCRQLQTSQRYQDAGMAWSVAGEELRYQY